ncbi:MAG: hypothetical protein PHW52_04380 [Candidatus Pacebacteria bacterium]|nr:hypothetical protein [Candidatus Paceibacterota bacterium]
MAQIELNKEQYLRLLKALGIASMMEEFITKDETEEEAVANKNYEFEDYLLGYAKEFGLEESDNEEDDWFDDLMADAYDLANDYGEADMFQRLAWQLALINFQAVAGKEFNADSDEDFEKAMEIEDQYLAEFENNGLNNLRIEK